MFDLMVMFGWHLLFYLSAYIVVVIAALVFQVFVTFFALVWMRGDMSPGVFLHGVQEAAVIAFCTSSSNVTLPTALKVAETDLGLPARVVRPVLGIGTVANQSGTTIYIAVTVLFIGQFFGMDLSLDRQALVFAIAMLAGMGTVGVPAGALPAVATVLALTGLPPEGIGLVIGVDRLLDMFRTLVNVVGDLAIAVAIEKEPVVARSDADIAARELPR
jgi:DAACS family dicarboxylate/amino acid:cation (Na+ or H+) symporter